MISCCFKQVTKTITLFGNTLSKRTRTAWAVFKYCGTKTVTLRMRKKYEKIDLKFISKETNKIRGKN
jgi:hypothetical protein